MEKRELSSQSNFLPTWQQELNLKSKDKGRRSEANDGEAYALVYGEGAGLFEGEGCHPLFILFWSLMSGPGRR